MARDNRELKPKTAAEEALRPSPWSRSRLSSMPLAVLLPPLADVGQLVQLREELEQLREGLQEESEAGGAEDRTRLQVEQNMLQQVFQWLDVDTAEE